MAKTANRALTATDIYKYIQCPHWPYYDRYATAAEKRLKRKMREGELRRQEDGVAHEAEVVARLMQGRDIVTAKATKDQEKNFQETLALMRRGVGTIYQGTLVWNDWSGRPDLLERREGKSGFGDWHYVPVDVKSTRDVEKYQKFQLAFYAALLEKIQGRMPDEASIINIEGVCLPFNLAGVKEEFRSFLKDLEAVVAGKKPDPVLRKTCYDVGQWGKLCEQLAASTDDIALLYNVDVNKLKVLRTLGIRTVEDAAEMDPAAFVGAARGFTPHALDTIKRQAQSLLAKSVIVRKPVEITTHGLEIHFDIESDPPNDVDYLYGFLIRKWEGGSGKSRDEYKAFVARSLEEEEEMWRSFLAWLETLPLDYTVYHFSPYELMRLRVLENRYGGSHWLDLFRTKMVDLKDFAAHNVTFPLYFYGLKHLAKFLGFRWRGSVTSGGESVDQFEKYLETGDRKILDEIILYNEDDVRATAFLKDWLMTYAREVTSYEMPYPWEG